MNAVQGSNHEIGNEQEYGDIHTSCAGDEAEVNGWPDEESLQQRSHPKQNYSQHNRNLMANRIRERLRQPELAELVVDLQQYGALALNDKLPPLTFGLFRQFGQTGERKAYEDAYFDRRGRLAAVAMLALVSDEPRVLHTLEDMLWAVCDEYTWCLTAHLGNGEARQVEGNIDLFAAETVHMLAEIAVIHGRQLDPLVLERIGAEAECRIFTPLYRQKRKYHWQTADHNWSAVCGGCCGMAAMLLLEDEVMVRESIRQTLGCMRAFLSGYGEDGGCAEGIGYWVYGFGYYVYYAEMLQDYSDGALNLLTGSKMAAIAAFPLRIHLSDGIFVNYSDSAEREEIPAGLLSFLAAKFQLQVDLPLCIPRLTDDPCRRWAHLLRNVMWSDPAVYEAEQQGAGDRSNGGVILHQLGWMVAKSVLRVPEVSHEAYRRHVEEKRVQAACSFKGGHNDEPHNHNDLGQFIIHCGGENIICDPGAGLYTQAYFAPGREQLFHISSAGHNVPLIDGCEQSSGRQAEAHTLECRLEPDGSELAAALDLTLAYPEAGSLQRYTREFCWRIERDYAGIGEFTCNAGRSGINQSQDEHIEVAVLRITDTFQWKASARPDAVQPSVEESSSHPARVIERWISRINPVLEKKGRLLWRAMQANVYLVFDAARWHVDTEAVHTIDHDHNPATFYRTSLVWTGASEASAKEQIAGKDTGKGSEDVTKIIDTATGDMAGVAPLEIVCQVHFVIEPFKISSEVSENE
ncbi:heparinase II/III family protein [Paenibacillus barcinonensis]|uniref:Heparinase II/III family protein n=1 Tax=Paenibacillus barcinonensis TaxID=198119 RepID=A0ABX6Q7I3_PAEBA|nr:heparinase II/III family protein [Paenibacillus barcinonensis]QKS58120.1 heparinase II/III family protein [Paenibacillus barcinonensis]